MNTRIQDCVKALHFVRNYFSYTATITATTEIKIFGCRSALLTPAIPGSINRGAENNFRICLKCSVRICLPCDPSNHQHPGGGFVGADRLFPRHRDASKATGQVVDILLRRVVVVPGDPLIQRRLQVLRELKGPVLLFPPAWKRIGIVMTRAFVVCIHIQGKN